MLKKFLIAAMALGLSPAWACPNLQGAYVCEAPPYEEPLMFTITQRLENDVTVYFFDTTYGTTNIHQVILADGIIRDTSDVFGWKYFQALCEENALITYSGRSSEDAENVSNFVFRFEKMPSQDILLDIQDEEWRGPERTFNRSQEICRRI